MDVLIFSCFLYIKKEKAFRGSFHYIFCCKFTVIIKLFLLNEIFIDAYEENDPFKIHEKLCFSLFSKF